MTKEAIDWLYRLKSNLVVYMPKEWHEKMISALSIAIKSLEQEPILDKIRAEIDELYSYVKSDENIKTSFYMVRLEELKRDIDKYKAEIEPQESEEV